MPSVLSAVHFHSEEAAYRFVEARLWADGRPCPHCGVIDKSGRLKGKSTGSASTSATPAASRSPSRSAPSSRSSHVKLHVWLQAMHLLCASKKGMSSNQLHRILGVTLQTAWFLSHRIREAITDFDIGALGPLGGEGKFVEADETFIGGRARNRAYKAPAPKKAVVALVERKGRVRSHHVPEVTAANLRRSLKPKSTLPRTSALTRAASTGKLASGSPVTAPSTTRKRNTFVATPLRTLPRDTSRYSNAGFTAFISTSVRNIFIDISPNSIFGTTTASSSASMTLNVPIAP